MTQVSRIQKEYVMQQLWNSTVRASLTRAGEIYASHATSRDRQFFRESLYHQVVKLVERYDRDEVDEQLHISLIRNLSHDMSTFCAHILIDRRFSFGHAQKVLNLFLKYHWCVYGSFVPPHFPVDRLIQIELGIKSPFNWTSWVEPTEYLQVIDFAKGVARMQGFSSLAELELSLYQKAVS
jgi:hypothetical protein